MYISNIQKERKMFNDIDDNYKLIHIRIYQRNGRKSITTIEGINDDLDFKKIIKYMKRNFKCNGKVIIDNTLGNIIQLQGDQRYIVKNFLLDMCIVSDKKYIRIHGF